MDIPNRERVKNAGSRNMLINDKYIELLKKLNKSKAKRQLQGLGVFGSQSYQLFGFSVSNLQNALKQFNTQICIIIYYYFFNPNFEKIMYYSPPNLLSLSTPTLFYYPSPPLIYFITENHTLTHYHSFPNLCDSHPAQIPHTQSTETLGKIGEGAREKGETCESLVELEGKRKGSVQIEKAMVMPNYSSAAIKSKEIKLSYRIQWKNENRNIVPNLINQMISFLLKPSKSNKLVHRLFNCLAHPSECAPIRYFQYVKKIKQSITHYVNESIFIHFFEIHQPHCQLYTLQEQQFYMKVCRIVMLSFLRNEIKLISLTSKRMSQAKRKMHLIARQALQNKFIQLCRTYTQ